MTTVQEEGEVRGGGSEQVYTCLSHAQIRKGEKEGERKERRQGKEGCRTERV